MQRDDKKYEASQFFWLIDELDYGVVLVDKDHQILWLNHAMEDLFSLERDAARGMDIMQFIRETVAPRIDDPSEFCDKVASSIAAGISVKNVERRLSGSEDSALWIEYSSQIVENGPFKGMRMDIYQNISLRKQLEQELSRHFGHLGEMIEERTRELTKVNEQLQREINDRRRIEEELSKERDFSSNLVRGSPAFFVALNPGMGVIMMNDSMLNALGCQSTEVVGKEYATTFVPEPDRASVAQFFRDVASRASFVHEHRLSARDGRYLLVEWHGRPVCKDDGSLDYYFAVGIDITERKRVETALAASEALYRTIFETTGSATIIINEDTTIALANTEFERLFGYKEEESAGRSWIELVQKGDIERMKEYHRLRRIDPNLAPRNYEFHLVDRHGGVRDVAMTIAMIPGSGRSVASLIDITERKRAEEEVRQHNRYLSAINQIIEAATSTETLDDFLACALEKTIALLDFDAGAVYIVDAQQKTAAVRAHRGMPEWFLPQGNCVDIHDDPYRDVYVELRPRYIEKRETGVLSIATIPFLSNAHAVGAIMLATGRQYTFSEGEKEVLTSIAKQIGSAITKRMLQEQLERSYRESKLYLDIISHDINNANNVSIMYGELLTEMLDGEKKEFADKLVSSIRRSIDIIGNVSKIRKLYEDKTALKPIELDAVVRSEMQNFPDAHIRYAGSKAIVVADDLLSEVFTNLIGNSVKFGGDKVDIGITVENNAEEVTVIVEDDGPGISNKLKPLIFNRFQRGETKASGKGLGLYLVRMLIERYGGSISVGDRVPTHPERGVAFRITLKKAVP